MAQRYKMVIQYDGGGFSGWQSQTNAKPGVQDVLSAGLERLGYDGVRIFGAGRTDSGVHALGQVAHFDLPEVEGIEGDREGEALMKMMKSLNYFIREYPVVVVDLQRVPAEFDARFSAVARHYVYKVVQRQAPLVHDRGLAWWIWQELDVDRMRQAAEVLLGRHDFHNFRLAACQAKSTVRTLDQLDISERWVEEHASCYIEFNVRARSFLHRQVRIMVGVLCEIGRGRLGVDHVERALGAEKVVHSCHAPAQGLYLNAVYY